MCSEFGEKKEVGLAYLGASRGVGYLLGPVTGQLLYTFFKFQFTFVILAGIMILTVIYSYIAVPSVFNKDRSKTDEGKRITINLKKT